MGEERAVSASDKIYQTWAEHPTRCVRRWLMERRLFSNDWIERAQDWDLDVLEQALRDDFSQELGDQAALPAIYKDLLAWALQQVDWREIAESFKLAVQSTDVEDDVSDSDYEGEEIEIEGEEIDGENIEGEDIGGEDIEGEDIEGEAYDDESVEDELDKDETAENDKD